MALSLLTMYGWELYNCQSTKYSIYALNEEHNSRFTSFLGSSLWLIWWWCCLQACRFMSLRVQIRTEKKDTEKTVFVHYRSSVNHTYKIYIHIHIATTSAPHITKVMLSMAYITRRTALQKSSSCSQYDHKSL